MKTGTGHFHYNFSQADSRIHAQGLLNNFRGRIQSSDFELLDSVEEHVGEEDEIKKGTTLHRKMSRNDQENNPFEEINASPKLTSITSRDHLPDEKFLMNSCNGCLILDAKFKVSEKPVRCLTLVE